MKVYKVTDPQFSEFGTVLQGYDFSSVFQELKKLPIPNDGIVYKPSIKEMEQLLVAEEMKNRGFGGMPIQLGYVGGNNKILNCLEYHKSSEFNIALDDVILVLGNQTLIKNGRFNTDDCKAFLVPAGTGVELYATTLHYAPMNLSNEGYRVICVLPLGTNLEKPEIKEKSIEDKMCLGSNKWLMAHKDSPEASNGAYIGLDGDNITFDTLKF